MTEEYRRRGWWRHETFLDDLRKSVRRNPEKTALAVRRMADDSTHTLDYSELERLTDRCAAALIDLGVRPGDTVAVQLPDRWELAVLALACPRAGARICPLLPVYRRRELETMLGLTEARVFVTMPELAGMAEGLAADLPSLEHVVLNPGELLAGSREAPDGRELGPDDPYLVLFTSGTTGEPKGVLHSQNTLYAAIRGEAGVFGLDESLVMATMSAYTHYTGWVQGMLMPVALGGTIGFPGDP